MSKNSFLNVLGALLVKTLPVIIRLLKVFGTLAMFLVGGGIFVHNLSFIHDMVHGIPLILADFIVGFVSALAFLAVFLIIKKIFLFHQKYFV